VQRSQCTRSIAMKDFSSNLLINILRATVDHVHDSLEIDLANPGLLELKRMRRRSWNSTGAFLFERFV